MAKKTTKTTVKTVTKSSKKGLIIGISVAVAVAAAGGVTAYLLLKDKGGSGPSEPQFEAKNVVVSEANTQVTFDLDWKPSGDIIEFSNFTFKLEKQKEIEISKIKPGTVGDRPLAITITFSKALEQKDNGELNFHYNDKTAKKEGEGKAKGIELIIPEPTRVATFKLDSTDYGTFKDGTDEFDISQYVGKTEFTAPFKPVTDYEGRDFTITIAGGTGTFTADYDVTAREISVSGNKEIQDKDVLTATLDLVEVATFQISNDSKTYGSLDDDTAVYEIDIGEYYGESEFDIPFYPAQDYATNEFEITIGDSSRFNAAWNNTDKTIKVTAKTEGIVLEDKEVLVAKIEPILVVTLEAGDGYFGASTVTQKIVNDIALNTTFAEAIKDVIKPTSNNPTIDPDDGGPDLSQSFVYYVDNNGNRIDNDYKITSNITATAKYELECLGFENISNTNQYISLTKTETRPEIVYTNPNPNVSYALSTDLTDWEVWSDYAAETPTTIKVEPGETVYFKGDNPSGFVYGDDLDDGYAWKFGDGSDFDAQETKIVAHGNPMGLIDNGACDIIDFPEDSGFFDLFSFFFDLDIDVDFVLPSTKLYANGYNGLFFNCYNLTRAPDLPITEIPADGCHSMFLECRKLLKPAKFTTSGDITLSGYYSCISMYSGCLLIDEMPDLSHFKFDSTAFRSLEEMFMLSSIKKVEKNKMPNISEQDSMPVGIFMRAFQGCTKLTEVDISNITRTGQWCFYQMFRGCTNLSSLTVGFGTADSNAWPTESDGTTPVTQYWFDEFTPTGETIPLPGPQSGTFYWKGTDSIDIGRSIDTIPETGWIIQTIS